MMAEKKNKKPESKEKSFQKGGRVDPQSAEAKAKVERDYASHPKFAKFKREGQ